MSLRVNLLKEGERRYQGPVSVRFAALVSGSLVGAITLLFLGIVVQRHFALRSNMKSAQREWQQIEAHYTQVTTKQKDLLANQALQRELQLWSKTRPAWSLLMPALQQITPASVQFTRLGIRTEWLYVKPPPPPVVEGGGAEESKKAAAKEAPAIPSRKFSVDIEGRAHGELADETVVQLVRTLREAATYQPLFESVKLQRLTREAGQGDAGLADRLFVIQGEFFLRKLE